MDKLVPWALAILIFAYDDRNVEVRHEPDPNGNAYS